MKQIIKKYIKLNLISAPKKPYYWGTDFRGNTNYDLYYLKTLFLCAEDDTMSYVSNENYAGHENERISIEVDNYDNTAEIIYNLDDPSHFNYIDDSDEHYQYSYVMNKDNFKEIVKQWKKYYDNLEPIVYIILLSNNKAVLQKSLTEDTNIICPQKFPQYITVLFSQVKQAYTKTSNNHPKLSILHSFLVIDENPTNILDIALNNKDNDWVNIKLTKNNFIITEKNNDKVTGFTLSFENFKEMFKIWIKLYKKKSPEIYFILEENNSITVQNHLENNEIFN